MHRALERLLHSPRRVLRELLGLVDLISLIWINRYGTSLVVEPGGAVVSLTTHGQRGQIVYIAIESIGRGKVRPSRLILWIDEVEFYDNLPPTLHRLRKRGLEIKLCENYRAHKKYYPYVESQEFFDLPLVTADDDILYPRYWLKNMVAANATHPDVVNCYFAGNIQFDGISEKMIMDGKSCHSMEASFCHHPIGLAGILHPPSFLMVLKRAGLAFQGCCPRNCDMWFHVLALRSEHRIRQIVPRPPYFAFQSIPGSQKTAMRGQTMDAAVAATYKESDLRLLRTACDAAQS